MIAIFLAFLTFGVYSAESKDSEVIDLLHNRKSLVIPPSIIELKTQNLKLENETYAHKKELEKVKFYLTNGEVRHAKAILSKLAFTPSKLRPVIKRYLAIISFIEGDYQKTFEELEQNELMMSPNFAKICTLKVITELVLSKLNRLEEDWPRCQLENNYNLNQNSLVWLDTLVNLKLKPHTNGITRIPFKGVFLRSMSNDDLKVILKLAIYLNQEELIEPQINDLTEEQVTDREVRELLGHLYFRMTKLSKSYKFIEDLNSPNAENIKGNLYLWRNKYEIAYAQFKLALEQKVNSQNAIERLLPLAWMLGDWKGGESFARKISNSKKTNTEKMTVLSAFLTQKSDFENAEKTLEGLVYHANKGHELEITQLYSFVSLMQDKANLIRKYGEISCSQYDILNCWVLYQLSNWDSFGLTIRRDDKIQMNDDWEKLLVENSSSPLNETVYINQLDIEELDDKLIKLTPDSP